jgi:hypothetical protein
MITFHFDVLYKRNEYAYFVLLPTIMIAIDNEMETTTFSFAFLIFGFEIIKTHEK